MSKLFFSRFTLGIFLALVELVSAKNSSFIGFGCSGWNQSSAKATAYYPAPSQGGSDDCRGAKSQTLQQYLAGEVDYVSVAFDPNLEIKYGTEVCIPELNEKYQTQIVFKVVDTASAFCCAGYSKINICVSTEEEAYDESVNGYLSVYFTDLQFGDSCCS